MVKTCSKCKVEKEVTEFHKDKAQKYGLKSQCKLCAKEYNKANKEKIKEYRKEHYKANKDKIKEYYEANKDKVKEYQKEYNKANREKIKEQKKQYYGANREKIKEYQKEHYEANKDKVKEYQKEYNKANKDKVKEYQKANKEKINEYKKNRRLSDPLYKMKGNLRTRTSQAFRNKGYSKNTKTQEMLGIDWEIAKIHIERQFKKGMNWSNQVEWHIDHIIPLASAKTQERLKQLCHYTNLQPLWATDNLSKSDSINGQQTMIRI